jgi:hypothetical protein
MAEENSQLRSDPSRAWLKRMFGWWKWPGYSTAGLGILRLFHFSEDVDFALKLLRAFGGELGMIATIVASPFFSIAMVGYGVLHLLFVGNQSKQRAIMLGSMSDGRFLQFASSLSSVALVMDLFKSTSNVK